MPKQAKKTSATQHHANPASMGGKISESVIRMAGPAKRAQETLLKTGHKNAEELMHTADNLNHVATECSDVCSDNISAFVESGNVAARILQNFSAGIMEGYSRNFSDCVEISKETFACRTTRDMVELQDRAVQHIYDNYLNISSKLYDLMLDSCKEVLEPLGERTALASGQVRKAMAA